MDAEVVVNTAGGKQHAVPYAFTELDPDAMFLMTQILAWGAKTYGHRNWEKIPITDHLNHAIIHIFSYLAGDHSESHLGNLMCRAMFAAALDIENNSPLPERPMATRNSQ